MELDARTSGGRGREVLVFTVFFDISWPNRYYAMFTSPASPARQRRQRREREEAALKRDAALRAAGRFDALELAESGGTIAGALDPAALPRLADRAVRPSGLPRAAIAWRIAGGHDALGRAALTVTLEGSVFLVCQRCLGPFAAPVAQETMLLLARDEAELARLDTEEPEVVLANTPLDPVALVEDELLLSLPFSPRHEQGECAAAGPARDQRGIGESPFAGLASLKAAPGSKQ